LPETKSNILERESSILERVVLEIGGVKIHPKEITSLAFDRGGDRFEVKVNRLRTVGLVVIDLPDVTD